MRITFTTASLAVEAARIESTGESEPRRSAGRPKQGQTHIEEWAQAVQYFLLKRECG